MDLKGAAVFDMNFSSMTLGGHMDPIGVANGTEYVLGPIAFTDGYINANDTYPGFGGRIPQGYFRGYFYGPNGQEIGGTFDGRFIAPGTSGYGGTWAGTFVGKGP
jgi:hypothetical protein